jgi:hypothetical protein
MAFPMPRPATPRYIPIVADWTTVAQLATAGGTLVLAAATFASVRSAHRSARITERSLLAQLRPVLVPTRVGDPVEKVGFVDNHWLKVEGQRGAIDITDDAIYLAFTVRNAGAGIAVLDRWDLRTEVEINEPPRNTDGFTRLSRDIYIPAGDIGFWQGAFRDPSASEFADVRRAAAAGERIIIDLLYEDHEGGQRTISRFLLTPAPTGDWINAVGRHWNIDRDDPR